jgi:hypothetical protein
MRAVEGLSKEPVLARFADWADRWRVDNDDLVVRKDGVAECILAAALLLDATALNCHCTWKDE